MNVVLFTTAIGPAVTVPTILPVAGSYPGAIPVTITCPTPNAAIYYTTDGTPATTLGIPYNGTFTVGSNTTVRAFATAPNMPNSPETIIVYSVMATVATPIFSVAPGPYGATQTVAIACSTPGASIFYTTNGATPTVASSAYTGPISVTATEVLKAIATAAGYAQSAVATAAYTIATPAATPTANIGSGAFSSTQQVMLTDATPGASIYYTTDGTTPTASSTLYSGTILVAKSQTIKFFATAPGFSPSAVAAVSYVIGSPIAPPNFRLTGQTQNTVTLAWDASTGPQPMASYNIYRGGTLYDTSTTTGYTDLSATGTNQPNYGGGDPDPITASPGAAYNYTVSAVDTQGSEGPQQTLLTYTAYANGVRAWPGDYNFNCNSNYSDTSGIPQGGTADIKITCTAVGSIWQPYTGGNVTQWDLQLGAFDTLLIDLKASQAGQDYHLSLVSRQASPTGDVFPFADKVLSGYVTGGFPVNQWVHVAVPLADLNIGVTTFTGHVGAPYGTQSVVTDSAGTITYNTATLYCTATLNGPGVDVGADISGPGIPANSYVFSTNQTSSIGSFVMTGPNVNNNTQGSTTLTATRTDLYKLKLYDASGVSNNFYFVDNLKFTGVQPVGTGSATQAPSAVQNLAVTPGVDQLTLTYQAPASSGSSAVTGFAYTLSPGGANGNQYTATPVPFTITGLDPTVTYTASVVAFNSQKISPPATATGTPNAAGGVTTGNTGRKAAILSYLNGLMNKSTSATNKLLVGQWGGIFEGGGYPGSLSTVMANVTPLTSQTGQLPAILGVVFNFVGSASGAYSLGTLETACANWFAKNGLVFASIYCSQPTSNTQSTTDKGIAPPGLSLDATTFNQIATPGTTYYKYWHAQLDLYIAEIKKVCVGGNVILLRPFIELNYTSNPTPTAGVNWYSAQTQNGGANFKAFWIDMYNYFMDPAKGINNSVIWVFNINGYPYNASTFYPGSAYVDVVSNDLYCSSEADFITYFNGNSSFLSSTGKPCLIAEMGTGTHNNEDMLNACKGMGSFVVGFISWEENYAISKQTSASTMMNDSYSVTLADLPQFTSAPTHMKMISRGVPAYASTGSASVANDSNYNTAWTSTSSTATLAFDLSGVASANRQQILLVWYNDATMRYDHAQLVGGQTGINNLSSYVVQVNAAAGGTLPTTGWVTAPVTSGNPASTVSGNTAHSRQHAVSFAGYNWVRLSISASDGSAGATNLQCNVDIFDASSGIVDGWVFIGDTIVDTAMGHGNLATVNSDAFTNQVGTITGNYPLQENWGQTGWATADWLNYLPTALPRCTVPYAALCLGSNDVLTITASQFYSNLVSLANMFKGAGMKVAVPTIPYSTDTTRTANIQAFNTQIQNLYAAYTTTVMPGPDLYTFFSKTPSYISSDQVTPTDAGAAALRTLWAQFAAANT